MKKVDKKSNKNLTIALLYALCGICWLVSGILNLKEDLKSILGYVDIGLTAVWFMLAILYYNKYKKEL